MNDAIPGRIRFFKHSVPSAFAFKSKIDVRESDDCPSEPQRRTCRSYLSDSIEPPNPTSPTISDKDGGGEKSFFLSHFIHKLFNFYLIFI